MKILKLLNKKYLSIILVLFFLFISKVHSNEPIDIWNLDIKKKNVENKIELEIEEKDIKKNLIYEMQSQKKNILEVEEDETLLSKKIEIVGLYDPELNGLKIDMWLNSDGEKVLNLLNKINKIKLSDDAKKILNISLLTNSYSPKKNISNDEFLNLKSDWLIKNANFKLIEDFLIKNQNIGENTKLIKFLVDEFV